MSYKTSNNRNCQFLANNYVKTKNMTTKHSVSTNLNAILEMKKEILQFKKTEFI